MKNLLAILAILASMPVSGQVNGFQLPYNPDSEPNGYIGVQDVLELLQLYGSEFNAALSFDEDSTSMVMEVGVMGVFECLAACDDLPSNWTVANMTDFGHALPNLDNATYLLRDPMMSATTNSGSNSWGSELFTVDKNSSGQIAIYTLAHTNMESLIRCLCATHERPKVEYSYCYSSFQTGIQDCANINVAEGWYPLGGVGTNTASTQTAYGTIVQAFWRWAE